MGELGGPPGSTVPEAEALGEERSGSGARAGQDEESRSLEVKGEKQSGLLHLAH